MEVVVTRFQAFLKKKNSGIGVSTKSATEGILEIVH